MQVPKESYDRFCQVAGGRLSRGRFISRMGAIGASAATLDALPRASRLGAVNAARRTASPSDRVTITLDNWINNLNPVLYDVVRAYNAAHPDRKPVVLEPTSTNSPPVDALVTGARRHTSSWDAYFGATPFVNVGLLHAMDAIEPWDPYLSGAFLRDLFPAVRHESTIGGKLYTLPMLLDTVGYAYRKDYFRLAGITNVPATWEDYIATAHTISTRLTAHKPRVYGATYDLAAWRCFIPIAHSIDTNIYTSEGYLDWANKEGVFRRALTYMKEIVAYAPPDIFNPGSLVTGSADEVEFTSGTVAMLEKYYNAPVRAARAFGVRNLGLARLPRPASGGAGGTVFWNTGVVLLKYGRHKQEVADFFEFLSYNQTFWMSSMFNAQPPCVRSAYQTVLKPWAPRYIDEVVAVMPFSRAIPIAPNNIAQFFALQDAYTPYLKGLISLDRAIADARAKTRKAIQTGTA